MLSPNRFFDPEPAQRRIAQELYSSVSKLPIVSPHSHVDPALLADDEASFGSPADLFIIPDHYVFRMLYSRGIPLESLGIPSRDGTPVEEDHRQVWELFAENFYLFRGTPTGIWLTHELEDLFGVEAKVNAETADGIHDHIEECLTKPEFRPRALFESFNIEVLCTTDAATDRLLHHKAIRDSGWPGQVRPTFRPDALMDILAPDWRSHLHTLCEVSGVPISSFGTFVQALENRREFFKSMGATATDHAVTTPYTEYVETSELDRIFQRALSGEATARDASRFTAHMVIEMARMSVEDGLVMQLHCGSLRDHNPLIYRRFGANMGCDIPIPLEFTRNLAPLLHGFGNDSRLTLIIFTLDEASYSRELAPLAGHYPALLLGPPWWFHDSINGMQRYRDRVIETAGLQNTAGFNDDTRAFPSIPARHDLSRRIDANWIAGLVARGIVDMEDAREMIRDTAYHLAKRAYKL